jgi:hypothetical protein
MGGLHDEPGVTGNLLPYTPHANSTYFISG